jgi:hypothetical protein
VFGDGKRTIQYNRDTIKEKGTKYLKQNKREPDENLKKQGTNSIHSSHTTETKTQHISSRTQANT